MSGGPRGAVFDAAPEGAKESVCVYVNVEG